MEFIILTNNSSVYEKYKDECDVIYKEEPSKELLITARDYIHKGYKLLTHPLSSSVKPNETPFKSVLISKEHGNLDVNSLLIIENSILTYDKFSKIGTKIVYTEKVKEDFKLIDLTVLESALNKLLWR